MAHDYADLAADLLGTLRPRRSWLTPAVLASLVGLLLVVPILTIPLPRASTAPRSSAERAGQQAMPPPLSPVNDLGRNEAPTSNQSIAPLSRQEDALSASDRLPGVPPASPRVEVSRQPLAGSAGGLVAGAGSLARGSLAQPAGLTMADGAVAPAGLSEPAQPVAPSPTPGPASSPTPVSSVDSRPKPKPKPSECPEPRVASAARTSKC